MTDVVTGSLQVDLKRRTTLPGEILAAAGIPAGSQLVARVEEPGRIVLESPALLLSRLQDDIVAALARPAGSTAHTDGNDDVADVAEGQPDGPLESAVGPTRDLAAELLADRAADSSLTISHDPERDQQDRQAEAEPESRDEGGTHHSRTSSDGPADPEATTAPSSHLPHPPVGAA